MAWWEGFFRNVSCILVMYIHHAYSAISWYQMFTQVASLLLSPGSVWNLWMGKHWRSIFAANVPMDLLRLPNLTINGFSHIDRSGGEVIPRQPLAWNDTHFFGRIKFDAHVFCNFEWFSWKKCAWSLGWFHIMTPVSLAVSQALAVSILDLHGINSFSRPSAKMVLKEVQPIADRKFEGWGVSRRRKRQVTWGVAPSQDAIVTTRMTLHFE